MCFKDKIDQIRDLNKNEHLREPSDFILDYRSIGHACCSTLIHLPGGHWFFDQKCNYFFKVVNL